VASQDFIGSWRLEPSRSTVTFRNASFWGLAKVKGTFAKVTGTGSADSADRVSGELVIDAASLDTGIGKRNDHLRSADFFDVEKYPTIEVTVDSVDVPEAGLGSTPAAVVLRAHLTIKGVQRSLDLAATASLLDDGAVQIVTQGALNRIDFGVDGNMMGMIGDTTNIEAAAVFLQQS
jgi:polyisoprenoid-binding protein YceI